MMITNNQSEEKVIIIQSKKMMNHHRLNVLNNQQMNEIKMDINRPDLFRLMIFFIHTGFA